MEGVVGRAGSLNRHRRLAQNILGPVALMETT